MKHTSCLLWSTALAASLCITSAVPRAAQATTMIAMTLNQLIDEAELVVMAEGIAADPFFSGTKVLTQVRMRVLEAWKGCRVETGDFIDVLTLGGEVGRTGQVVAGAAKLPLGRPMVLFLRSAASHTGEYHVLGLGQGAWHLANVSLPISPHTPISQTDVDLLVGGARPEGPSTYTMGQLREAVKERADEKT